VDTSLEFGELSVIEQNAYARYYRAVSDLNQRRLIIMARESATQLCLQNAIVVYEFFHHPLYELDQSFEKRHTFYTKIWCKK